MANTNRQLIFAPRPDAPLSELFELREAPIPEPGPGEVLIRNLICSCDPAQVGWLMSASRHAAKVAPGFVMRAWCAGHVVASRHERFNVGERVWGTLGWQDYALCDGSGLLPLSTIPEDIPLSAPLGVAGINGITAYLGLVDLCHTGSGERVVVSTAAGATGSAAVQIARNLGAHVVGIAGSQDKCRFVQDVLGAEDCIDYKTQSVQERLAELCPSGVDVYFDNVGGSTLDTLLGAMAYAGRIALCGATSLYGGERASHPNLDQALARTLSLRGFVMYEQGERFAPITQQLYAWMRSGQLRAHETVVHGLANAPAALQNLFQGRNVGKQLVALDNINGIDGIEGAATYEAKLSGYGAP